MNPQDKLPIFYEEYCLSHSSEVLSMICLNQKCEKYLSLECVQCHAHHSSLDHQLDQEDCVYQKHSHNDCKGLENYIRSKLFPEVLSSVTKRIKNIVNGLKHKVDIIFNKLSRQIEEQWYFFLEQSCTKKDYIDILENPSKLAIIASNARLKDQIITHQVSCLVKKIEKQYCLISQKLSQDLSKLKYKVIPINWKFNPDFSHQLINISPSSRTVDKKSEVPKFCLGILNQPITPMKNQVSFAINSQNMYQKSIIIGLCDPNKVHKFDYELPVISFEPSSNHKKLGNKNQEFLKHSQQNMGLYAIYQASNYKSSNNALSLHSCDEKMNYKELVGWNFGSGDTITVGLSTNKLESEIDEKKQLKNYDEVVSKQKNMGKLWFQRNNSKDKFEMEIKLGNGLLYPFVALYSAGDKVTVQLK